jgi:hypothetical protein
MALENTVLLCKRQKQDRELWVNQQQPLNTKKAVS